jgi:teichuronic acid biosynthesis glycosyltransferase TuaC
MKVLFVSSGNSEKISPIISAQGKSLEEIGICGSFFLIQGKGIPGYVKNIPKLRRHLKNNNYDILHAHFSLSGFVTSLAGANRVIVSLMGDDVLTSRIFFITKLFTKYSWEKAIVKSGEMKERLGENNIVIVPNGVDLNTFKPMEKRICQKDLNFSKDKLHLLFAANPKRKVKNYDLFKGACDLLQIDGYDTEIHYLDNIPHQEIPLYMNAADVVCLSSLSEGSPNVIKEALACNRPIVSTDVGDVKWVVDDIDGCYVSSNNKNEYYLCLQKAISFSMEAKRTSGRDRLIELGLDSDSVAKKLVEIYRNVLKV